ELGLAPAPAIEGVPVANPHPVFVDPEEIKAATLAEAVIQRMAAEPNRLPNVARLSWPEIQAEIVRVVEAEYAPVQTELGVGVRYPDIAAVVAKTTQIVERRTIDIPRILIVPKGHVTSRFESFELDLSSLRYPPVSEDLWIQHLRTGRVDVLAIGGGGVEERRLEDYVVSGLIGFDDVSYDDHADLLYELAGQVVRHLREYLSDADARKVLRYHQKEIARFVHVQMQPHFREDASEGYDVVISRGISPLKESAYTASVSEGALDYRYSPADKSNLAKYLFSGFSRCLYDVQKFHSDSERRMAVILERDALKWMKPAKGQFQIFYRSGVAQAEYQPDFVAETETAIHMIEVKARNEMSDPEVLAKRTVAEAWCGHASAFAGQHAGKPWRYSLIPHDTILDNASLGWLIERAQ
ncbi:MAG TPA: hypothetical protein VIP11_26925, partial [Gemmatimonadaceae bacterium]